MQRLHLRATGGKQARGQTLRRALDKEAPVADSLPDTFDKRLPINIAGRKWDTDWTERTDTHGFLRGFIFSYGKSLIQIFYVYFQTPRSVFGQKMQNASYVNFFRIFTENQR